MTGMRRLILVLAAVLALGGCGVPDSSKPFEIGDAPAAGDPVLGAGTVKLPTRDGVDNPLELARRFFMAGAAADWDPDRAEDQRIEEARSHAEQFLVQDLRKAWGPGKDIYVADVTLTEALGVVTASVTPVGVLDANGAVNKLLSAGVATSVVQFKSEYVNGIMLLSLASGSQMPPYLVLSLEGLRTLFEERAVYYWDKTNAYLVPDRRYVSLGLSNEKRVRAIIKQWLLGPSLFLRGYVAPQTVTNTLDNPSLNGDRVTVNLPPRGPDPNQEDALRHIAWQLRWSLHRNSSSVEVEIQVNGRAQVEDTDGKYLAYNPSQPRPGQGGPDESRLFAVQDGIVTPVSRSAVSPTILARPENSQVLLAAVNRSTNMAALVRKENNKPVLWIGRNRAEPPFGRVNFPKPPDTISRPSFVPRGEGRVLVAADGLLWYVSPDGAARQVPLKAEVGDVVAVSVAPDGARVALATSTGAWVAGLDAADVQAQPRVGEFRPLYTGGVTSLRGISWVYEDRLVVCGGSAMADVAIDSGRVDAIKPSNLGENQYTQVASVQGNPFDGNRGSIVVEAGAGQAYYAFRTSLDPIVPLGTPSPAPSSSASGAPGGTNTRTVKLSAPFYLDEFL